LYRSTRDRLAVQIAALTGDPFEAKDLVQEAFMRAWVRWEKVGAYEDPEGWVRRVAHNLAISRWRQARWLVLRPSPRDGALELTTDESGVLEALHSLSTRPRRAIILHHVAGLSVAEVASEMNVPVGTVKSWLSRGRTQMMSQMVLTEKQS
jgi:RNA polymerase sigma-70 factor, ECF subfamily